MGGRSRRRRAACGPRWTSTSLVLWCLAGALLAGCGEEIQHQNPPTVGGPNVEREVSAPELLPEDLNLGIRIDLGRMRQSLGDTPVDRLEAQMAGTSFLRNALLSADVIWIGLRLGDIDAGDRVLVLEGDFSSVEPDVADYKPGISPNGKLQVYERTGFPDRSDTARVIRSGDGLLAFVTPIELDAVDRVIVSGPDQRRPQPSAEGLVSLNVQKPRLPPYYERKYPSIAAVISGIDELKAQIDLTDGGVTLEATFRARHMKAADRILRFLEAMSTQVEREDLTKLFASFTLEQVDTNVLLTWTVEETIARGLLLELASQSEPGIAQPPPGDD